jgi:hypothetical protein
MAMQSKQQIKEQIAHLTGILQNRNADPIERRVAYATALALHWVLGEESDWTPFGAVRANAVTLRRELFPTPQPLGELLQPGENTR